MMKYFALQEKRMLRVLPLLLCVTLVLAGCLGIVYRAMTQKDLDSEKNEKFRIAMVGTADDRFLQMGVSALTQMDASRYSLEIVEMEESEARKALDEGWISAYAVIPEGFVDAAMHGYFLPLKLVTTSGAAGLVSIVKEEITGVISDILLAAQKGIYGTWDAMTEAELLEKRQSIVDGISIAYTELALNRTDMYQEKELGISDGLGYDGYLLCGLLVLFLMLMLLPFGLVLIHRGNALQNLLVSRGHGVLGQMACEYGAFFLSTVCMVAVLMGVLGVFGAEKHLKAAEGLLTLSGFLKMLPVLFVLTALSFFLFETAGNLVTGMLLMFFVTLVLCFVGGCMYPAYFFPDVIEKMAGVLPTGLAREQLASCITGGAGKSLWLLLWGCGFWGLAYLTRSVRNAVSEGVAQ